MAVVSHLRRWTNWDNALEQHDDTANRSRLTPSRPERRQRPWTWRHSLRVLVVLAAVVAGVAVTWSIGSHDDGAEMFLLVGQGVVFGSLVGTVMASRIPLPADSEDLRAFLRGGGEHAADDDVLG